MVKRKQKKAIKQKQKVNVKQNVKVVIGDIKKKRAVRSSGASAKPPIVLNISNPQPPNNMFMEYFRKQLQNQQPIKANTLAQYEKINEREETKASKAGALHKLDQDPGKDQEMELRRQEKETKSQVKASKIMVQDQILEMRKSLKPVSERKIQSEPLRPRQKSTKEMLMESIRKGVNLTPLSDETEKTVIDNLQNQQNTYEEAMDNPFQELEDEQTRVAFPRQRDESNSKGGAGIEEVASEPAPKRKGRGKNKTAEDDLREQVPAATPKRKGGRRRLTEEEIQARLKEEARLRAERIGMSAEDKPKRGRKMLSQEEIEKRRKVRELQKLQRLFEGDSDY